MLFSAQQKENGLDKYERPMTAQEKRGLDIFTGGIHKKCGDAFVVVKVGPRVVGIAMTLDYKYFHRAIVLPAYEDENLGDTAKRCLSRLKNQEKTEDTSLFDTVMTELAEELEDLTVFDRSEYIDFEAFDKMSAEEFIEEFL